MPHEPKADGIFASAEAPVNNTSCRRCPLLCSVIVVLILFAAALLAAHGEAHESPCQSLQEATYSVEQACQIYGPAVHAKNAQVDADEKYFSGTCSNGAFVAGVCVEGEIT